MDSIFNFIKNTQRGPLGPQTQPLVQQEEPMRQQRPDPRQKQMPWEDESSSESEDEEVVEKVVKKAPKKVAKPVKPKPEKVPCQYCGKAYVQSSIVKHQNLCARRSQVTPNGGVTLNGDFLEKFKQEILETIAKQQQPLTKVEPKPEPEPVAKPKRQYKKKETVAKPKPKPQPKAKCKDITPKEALEEESDGSFDGDVSGDEIEPTKPEETATK